MQAPGWMSVVVYDPIVDILEPVISATDTSDYMLDGIDNETKQLNIFKYTVKTPADWSNEKLRETNWIRADFPPFG
jgi:hypothetical protein